MGQEGSGTVKKAIELDGVDMVEFLGFQDSHLRFLRKRFSGVNIVARGNRVLVEGPPGAVERVAEVIKRMLTTYRAEGKVDEASVMEALGDAFDSDLVITTPKKKLVPRSPNQERYIRAMLESDMVFGIGPAGTGKTYLAVAMALKFLKEGRVERLVFTRPAVETGESLGFLPGSYTEKIFPYLVPLYDALYSLMPHQRVQRLQEKHLLEIAPLAYMRGRTLADAFIILDEAQNTRAVQMKMFLTRLGPRSRVVVTGDITQIDLPRGVDSGLVEAERVLKGVRGTSFVYFSSEDVVRHRLVKDIVEAYEKKGENRDEREETRG